MSWPRVIAARLRGLFRHKQLDDQLDSELRFHLEMQIEDNVRAGMTDTEARSAARQRFGAIESVKEDYRERRTFGWLETAIRDVRYAVRVLRRSPGFTMTAVATLSVALGASTAMLSVLDRVFRPLPYRSPDQLATLFVGPEGDGRLAYATVEDWRRHNQSFEGLAVSDPVSLVLTRSTTAELVTGLRVSANYFTSLGIQPLHGRVFSEEEASQQQRLAVISHRLMVRLFGGDSPAAVGSFVELDGRSSRIIGVLPQQFSGGVDLWEPHTLFPNWDARRQARGAGSWFVTGRLKPGVTFERAQEEMNTIGRRLDAELPADRRTVNVRVVRLSDQVVGPTTRTALWILMGAVLCVLLIAAANVASLSLARSTARERELAVRSALGASRGRIVSQLLAESLTLTLISGVLGTVVAYGAVEVMTTLAPADLAGREGFSLSGFVVASSFCLSTLTGLLIGLGGLGPAAAIVRDGAPRVHQEGGRTVSAGLAAQRLRRALVVFEFAMAIGLAVGAGLLIRSLWSLGQVDSGFHTERVLAAAVSNPSARPAAERPAIYGRILDEANALPGVERASVVSDILASSAGDLIVVPEDRQALTERMRIRRDEASAGLFATVGTPFLNGRDFSPEDRADSPRVAIINATMARRLWGTGEAVGRRFTVGTPTGESVWWTVVGVVGDMRRQGLEQEAIAQMFEAITQNPPRNAILLVRTSTDQPLTIADAVRAAVHRADSRTPVYGMNTLEILLGNYSAERRFQTSLLIAFAAVALLLSAIGIYGLMHYSVAVRRQEIATRLAIGAAGSDIFRMIVGEGFKLTAVGLAIGLAIAVLIGRAGSSLLFSVTPTDPITFASVSILLTMVAATACSLPAWRAMRIDPVVALGALGPHRPTHLTSWRTATRRVSRAMRELTADQDVAPPSAAALNSEFGGLIHRAASFDAAIDSLLSTLRIRLRAESVQLLRKDGDVYRADGCSVAARGVLLNQLKSSSRPLSLSPDYFGTWRRWAAECRPDAVTEIVTLERAGARMASALRTKGGIAGVLLLGPPQHRDSYNEAEAELLDSAGAVLALMLENARLSERALEQERLRRDLALAAEVQRRLLPENLPDMGALSLAAFMRPARTVGGDYYDVLELPCGKVVIAVADIAGKGIAAALLMAVLQGSLRAILSEGETSCAALARRMNRILYQSSAPNSYATFFYAQIDPQTRHLAYVNAGHTTPYLIRATQDSAECIPLDTGGTVLGMFPDATFEEAVLPIHTGDLLAAFTDGITEARNALDEEYGEERLKALLQRTNGLSSSAVASLVREQLSGWTSGVEAFDDCTFVAARANF